jgi:hypothetical protein
VYLVDQAVAALPQLPQVLLLQVWVQILAEVFVSQHRCVGLLV